MPTRTAAAAVPAWQAKVDALRAFKPREESVTIDDPDAVEAVQAATSALMDARSVARAAGRTAKLEGVDLETFLAEFPAVVTAEKALEESKAAAREAAISFTFKQLPPDVYDQFSLGFPPNEEQEKLGAAYDATTYVPALVAACSADDIPLETIEALMAESVLNQGDLSAMFLACRQVNEQSRFRLGKD